MTLATGQINNFNKEIRSSGFSLFELLIVILLIGLIMLMVIPSISALDDAELRTSQHDLAGAITDAYGRAALDSVPYRLVFDFESNAYWLEKFNEEIDEEEDSEQKALALGQLFSGKKLEEASGDLSEDGHNEGADKDSLAPPTFKAVDDKSGEKKVLPKAVVFWGFYTAPMKEWQKKGKAYLYFFPGGQTQNAYIALGIKDDEDDNLTLETRALTGKTVILNELPEI